MRWIIIALVAVSLAGCADETPTEVIEPEFQDVEEIQVGDGTGVIRGVVVDETITPLADVRIVLLASGDDTRTNADGAFVFAGLEPGPHVLEARALGYQSVQSSVVVEADVAKPPTVRILLESDPAGLPYFQEFSFNGYIECGTNVAAICGGVRDFTGLGDDTYSAMYETGGNITHLQTEMIWSNTQTFGDSFKVNHRYGTQEQFDGGFYTGSITGGAGPSPLMIVTDADKYNEAEIGQGEYKFMTSIFAGGSEAVPQIGIALQQKYDMYIHEFHGYAPPEGWRFSTGDGVPGPEA